MKTKVVDFCTFYGEYGSEYLLLRYNVLKDYVDEFVVSESNCSHSGVPVEYKCRERIKEWGLPEEKFRIIELDIPPSDVLEIEEIDVIHSTFENIENGTRESQLARARVRLQKNSLMYVLDQYDNDTVFIHGDIDEIVNPKYIETIVEQLNGNPYSYFTIPMVHLEGSADLAVCDKNTNIPTNITATFICKKDVLYHITPLELRVGRNIPNHIYQMSLVEGGNEILELGWHFSWMGDRKSKIKKSNDFEHYADKFSNLVFGSYNNSEQFLENHFKEGDIPPCGRTNLVLGKYDKSLLPKECFTNPIIKEYLFPYEDMKLNFYHINSNHSPTGWIVDNFYENPDAVREFALNQEYVEGGFGRGFIGRRTEKQFLFPGLKEKFEKIIGMKITEWESHGMNGRFQNAHSGEPLVWHCDSQKWGGMLYLTPDAPYQCGTTLYAHKKTRARSYYDEGWDAAWKDIPGDPHLDGTSFEPVDVLGNVYNRLVIFDASNIHSASEYFGTVMENSRLWQMFFFDT